MDVQMKEAGIRNFTEHSQSIQQVIIKWARHIKRGNSEEIYECFKQQQSKLKFLNEYIDQLITTVYTSSGENMTTSFATEYFDRMLKFVEGLPDNSSQLVGLIAIRKGLQSYSLEHSKEMLKLTYRVKELIKLSSWNTPLTNFYNSLPKTFRKIIEGDTCYIKNDYFGEYLYASNVKFPGTSEREIYTWMPKEKVVEGRWKFESWREGDEIYFYIVSHHWRESVEKYLYRNSFSTSVTLREKSSGRWRFQVFDRSIRLWELQPVYENKKEVFNIVRPWVFSPSEDVDLALFAGGVGQTRDSERRKVFTLATESKRVGGQWEISCV